MPAPETASQATASVATARATAARLRAPAGGWAGNPMTSAAVGVGIAGAGEEIPVTKTHPLCTAHSEDSVSCTMPMLGYTFPGLKFRPQGWPNRFWHMPNIQVR